MVHIIGMEHVVWALLAILATYRLSRMIAFEDGPWDICLRFRTQVRVWTRGRGDHWLWRGVNCPLCIGFWIAWPIALLLPWLGWAMYIISGLGLAGGAAWIYKGERH